MNAWGLLVYLSAGVVYFAVAATIWGAIRHARSRSPEAPRASKHPADDEGR